MEMPSTHTYLFYHQKYDSRIEEYKYETEQERTIYKFPLGVFTRPKQIEISNLGGYILCNRGQQILNRQRKIQNGSWRVVTLGNPTFKKY